jgi:uncharacterized membrane protein (DUF4010 family)
VPDLDLTLAWNFATALLIGALIGIERERHKQRNAHPEIAGLRTFVLFALLGALCGWLGQVQQTPWLLAAGLLAAAGFVIAGYVLQARATPVELGLTTEVAAVATFLLGALATLGERELAVSLGVIVAAVLAYKQPLHGFVEKLGSEDVYAALRLLLATFIILPLLPDRALDPWQALNPRSLWLLALLIAGLSLVGYVLTRLLGAQRGIPLTGVTGGLVSSTAVTLAFARQSREPTPGVAGAALASGVLLAWTVSFARVLIAVLVVNRALLPSLLPSMLAMSAACALFAGWHLLRAGRDVPAQTVPLRNPFSLRSALKFTAIFALVLLTVKIVQAYAPETGLYYVAVLAGATDVDAITLSLAQYARTGSMALAAQSITLAVLSNTLVKTAMVVALGSPALRRSILAASAGILAAGAGAIVLA